MNQFNGTQHYVAAFYQFMPLENPELAQKNLEAKAEELGVKGLVILGREGFNSTCSSHTLESFEAWKNYIKHYFNTPDLVFKESMTSKSPFRRFKVKIREEIVTAGIPEMTPPPGKNNHLTPEEWDQVLTQESDYALIDTRNWYEYKIGTFRGAINPNLEKFTEFPRYIDDQGIPKDKKILIFCTGGIRCEKGILELQKQGYKNVYQLDGGILNYFKESKNSQYDGECFVFDHRVAVDQKLQPTLRYGLCPHCGQPGESKITCTRCDSEALICETCAAIPFKQSTCSKNCAHHFELNPSKKGQKQVVPFEIKPLSLKNSLVNKNT